MTLKFDNTDLFRLEDEFNIPIPVLIEKMAKGSFKMKELYILFWIGSHSDLSFDEFSNTNSFVEIRERIEDLGNAISKCMNTGEKKKELKIKKA